MQKYYFFITGMTDPLQEYLIEKRVGAIPGIEKVLVNYISDRMTVYGDEDQISEKQIRAEVERAGFRAFACKEKSGREFIKQALIQTEEQIKQTKKRLISSVILSGCLFFLFLFEQMNRKLPSFIGDIYNVLTLTLTELLLIMAILYVNRNICRSGIKTLLLGQPQTDSLILLGSGIGVAYGTGIFYKLCEAYGTQSAVIPDIKGYQSCFFTAAAILLTLYAAERMFEYQQKKKALSFALDVFALQTEDTVLLPEEEKGPMENLSCGDIGPADKDTRLQADSERKEQSGIPKIKAAEYGENAANAKNMEMVYEAAISGHSDVESLKKQLSDFISLLIAASVMAVAGCLLTGTAVPFVLTAAMAILMIGWKRAVLLSADIAVWKAAFAAQKNAVFYSHAEVLEKTAKINTVVWNGIGTLTEQKPKITDILVADGVSEEELLCIAASLEPYSKYSFAKTIVQYTKEKKIPAVPVTQPVPFYETGITAKIGEHFYCAGNIRLMHEKGIDLSCAAGRAEELKKQGKSVVYFAGESKLLGLIAVSDSIRSERIEDIACLKKLKIKNGPVQVVLISEEDAATAQKAAQAAGVDRVISEALSEDRAGIMKKLQDEGSCIALITEEDHRDEMLAHADLGVVLTEGERNTAGDICCTNKDSFCGVDVLSGMMRMNQSVHRNIMLSFLESIAGTAVLVGLCFADLGILGYLFAGAGVLCLFNVLTLLFCSRPKAKKEKSKKKAASED